MGKGGYNGGSTVIHAGSGWFGRGSVTSQPADKKKSAPAPTKLKRNKKAQKGSLGVPKKGNGLTRSDIVAKAAQKVRSIESEIAKTKQRLATLERDLAQAMIDVKNAQSLPPKTATRPARYSADEVKEAAKAAKRNDGKLTDAERKAERVARQNFRTALKEVVVEERMGGRLVGKRTVERS